MPGDRLLGRALRAVEVVAGAAGGALSGRRGRGRSPGPARPVPQSEWQRAQTERLRTGSPDPARQAPAAADPQTPAPARAAYVPAHAAPAPPAPPSPTPYTPMHAASAPPPAPEPATPPPAPPEPSRPAPEAEPPEAAATAADADPPVQSTLPEPVRPVRLDPETVRMPEPRPSRRRGVHRSNLWLAGIVLALLAVGSTAYWVLRVHQRIAETSLEHQIATRNDAQSVRCVELQSDGAVWACGVFYNVESVCLIAKVNPLGSWSTTVGTHRCQREPQLVALLPKTVTGTGVAADVNHQLGAKGTVCVKLPGHQVRWLCQLSPTSGNLCKVVRVVDWTSWNEKDGGRLCTHTPALRKAVRAARA